MDAPPPLTHDLVLLGGGHTHALVLRKWGMDRLAGVRLTLVNPGVTAPYTGMLPGHVAGHYRREALDIDLMRLARFAGARLVCDRAVGIDRGRRLVHLAGRPPVRYDLLSVDIGITADLPAIPGFSEHAQPVKPLGPFATAWTGFVARVKRGEAGPACAIIGGGVAGVEVALAMAHRLASEGVTGARITVIEAGAQILAPLGNGVRRYLRRRLDAHGIETVTSARPARITARGLVLSDGTEIAADFVLSAAGARSHDWLGATGLALTDGFIDVGPTLQSTTDPAIFAVGDCAHLTQAPRPKAGVYAVREAPVLFHNLRGVLAGSALRRYRPQRDYLKIISTGERSAVAEKFGLRLSGAWLWRLKDHIDRAFMDRFQALPAMQPAAPRVRRRATPGQGPSDDMLCGGCGAKVSRQSLQAGLAQATHPARDDVLLGTGDDAAVLRMGTARQVIAVDHLRAFTEDPWMLARIAAVHALGDIWAMGAAPQAGLLSVILPRMDEAMQAATLGEITHAARGVLREAGADLVGGHTSLGAELTIGLTVTGLCDTAPVTLGGARPGDRLILTKPIGTGVLLAGEMRGVARGQHVAAALDSMARPLSAAAAILAPSAHAMTDVTGFGLAGHLLSMLEASGLAATLSLGAVPLLPGALDMAGRGTRSSIWDANVDAAGQVTRPPGARSDLLFDPQTAGGLLAAVADGEADRLLRALGDAGEQAAIIGQLRAGTPSIDVEDTAPPG